MAHQHKQYLSDLQQQLLQTLLGKDSWQYLCYQQRVGQSNQTKILPAVDVPFKNILEYDTHIYSFSRQRFLEKWLVAPNSHAYVAVSNTGRVVGYAVVRTVLRKEEGWRRKELLLKIRKALFVLMCRLVTLLTKVPFKLSMNSFQHQYLLLSACTLKAYLQICY